MHQTLYHYIQRSQSNWQTDQRSTTKRLDPPRPDETEYKSYVISGSWVDCRTAGMDHESTIHSVGCITKTWTQKLQTLLGVCSRWSLLIGVYRTPSYITRVDLWRPLHSFCILFTAWKTTHWLIHDMWQSPMSTSTQASQYSPKLVPWSIWNWGQFQLILLFLQKSKKKKNTDGKWPLCASCNNQIFKLHMLFTCAKTKLWINQIYMRGCPG